MRLFELPLMRSLAFGVAGLLAMSTQPLAYAQTPGVIKIVSSLPHTGSANAQITTIVNGVKLAIDEVGGKVGDFAIKYEAWDDASPERGQWDPAVEAANADKHIASFIASFPNAAADGRSLETLRASGKENQLEFGLGG